MSKAIILDRDGVINKLIYVPNINSPMNINEIELFDNIPKYLKQLNDLGYDLYIATNQPAAAKGKISKFNLDNIHNEIVKRVESKGAKIVESFICYHKREDNCECRKPKVGLLEQAFNKYNFDKKLSWMIGDNETDIIAGKTFGLKTVLIDGISTISTVNLYKFDLSFLNF
jgi:histidinol-phosphate phosphatase family protein